MRKVVANADVAAVAGARKARYGDGSFVSKIEPPAKPLDPAEAFGRLEQAVRAIPSADLAPVMQAMQESREATLSALAAANRPRKFTMDHERNDKGQIVRTIVKEE